MKAIKQIKLFKARFHSQRRASYDSVERAFEEKTLMLSLFWSFVLLLRASFSKTTHAAWYLFGFDFELPFDLALSVLLIFQPMRREVSGRGQCVVFCSSLRIFGGKEKNSRSMRCTWRMIYRSLLKKVSLVFRYVSMVSEWLIFSYLHYIVDRFYLTRINSK